MKAFKARSKKTKTVKSYKSEDGTIFQPGDVVRLNKKAFRTNDPMPPLFLGNRINKGKIVALFPDVKGLVQVEPKLGGFWTWSVEDLRKV